MAQSLWNESDRRSLCDRLARLDAAMAPKWGRMDAVRMVVHLTDSLRMSTGELAVRPKPGPLRLPVLKTLVMFYLPWPKSVPTAPELLDRSPGAFPQEVERLSEHIDAFTRKRRDERWPDHPAFG